MSDAVIRADAVQFAPAGYTVPGAQEILVKSVRAVVDGSGAGAPFDAVLQLIDPAGNVVWQAPTDTTIAAGGSADVSWFPRVGAAAAATPSTSTGLAVASLFNDPANGSTVTHGVPESFVSIQDGVANAGFATTDATVFANGSTTLFTGSPVFGVQISKAGTYMVFNNAFTKSGGAVGSKVTTYWAASNGSAPSSFQQGRSAATRSDTWDQGQSGIGPHNFLHEWMTVSGAQTPAILAVWGSVTGASDVVVIFQMMVVQVSTLVLAKL